jgi:hypothetical protein
LQVAEGSASKEALSVRLANVETVLNQHKDETGLDQHKDETCLDKVPRHLHHHLLIDPLHPQAVCAVLMLLMLY